MKVSEGKPWKETLLEVLPIRKFREGNKPHHKYDDTSKDAENDDEILNNDDDKSDDGTEMKPEKSSSQTTDS